MRTFLVYFAMFQAVLACILFLCAVLKWYMLKSRIEANGWKQVSPCGWLTLVYFLIPLAGPTSFLAVMTILDQAAESTKVEADNLLGVRIGPWQFSYSEEWPDKPQAPDSIA